MTSMQEDEHFNTTKRLHTHVLRDVYGPINAEVLRHDDINDSNPGKDRVRIARLVDVWNTLRTYALTLLTYDKSDTMISQIDKKIKEWWLIGETFLRHGYQVKKNVIDVFLVELLWEMKTDFDTESTIAKARITEFYAKASGLSPVTYWIVLEIYSPDFRDPDLWINDVDIWQLNPTTWSLINSQIPLDEVRRNLDKWWNDNKWFHREQEYEDALEHNKWVINRIRKTMLDIIWCKVHHSE